MTSPLSPGTVDLTIEIENTSPNALTAAVYNSLGILQETFSPGSSPSLQLSQSPDTYGVLSLDVSDHLNWPGGFVSVLWTDTLPSPDATYSRLYTYVPYALNPNDKTIVTWAPYTGGNSVGYSIGRKFASESAFTAVGYSAYPVFIDETVFENELTACTVNYEICVLGQDTDSPAATELIVKSTINSDRVQAHRTGEDICLLTGKLLQVDASADMTSYLTIFVHDQDAPVNLGPTHFLNYQEVIVPVNEAGQFAAPLVQGLITTIHAPDANFSKRFVVPAQAHVNLSDVSPIPLERELCRGE